MISAPARRYDYVTVPAEIYRRSFATIRSEVDLSRLPEDMRTVAVRMIHACGDVDLAKDLAFHPRLVSTVRAALAGQAAIFTDTQMLAAGITRRRLPADAARGADRSRGGSSCGPSRGLAGGFVSPSAGLLPISSALRCEDALPQ